MSYALQKVNRFYDQDHPENVFDIQGSRVTGYSSSLWNDATQSALYIYRLWDGSIADTRKAIERNIDMKSTITPMNSVQDSVNWDFSKPTISGEIYNETVVQPEAPTTIGNYVGRSLTTLQAWADSFNIPVYVTYQEDTSVAAGTILAQDVAEGTSIDSISAINVTVANASAATAEPTATPTATPTSIATATPAATPTPTPATATPATPAPTPTPTPAPTPTPTPTPTVEPTPVPPAAESTPATDNSGAGDQNNTGDTGNGDGTNSSGGEGTGG